MGFHFLSEGLIIKDSQYVPSQTNKFTTYAKNKKYFCKRFSLLQLYTFWSRLVNNNGFL